MCIRDRLKDVYDRCAYYDDKVCSGEMSTAHAQNSLAKMLREDFGIKARGKRKIPTCLVKSRRFSIFVCGRGGSRPSGG